MGLWKRIKEALSRFAQWLDAALKPPLKQFLYDNRGLALEVVMKVAREFAVNSNEIKRAMAIRLIKETLIKEIPNIVIKDHWLGLLVELAVAILKSQGKI